MSTRLAVFCDRLLEAGWLAALIVAPLYFNIYSSRTFEPDKITLVRSIALVMVGAWIIKQFEVGRRAAAPEAGPMDRRAWLGETWRTLVRGNPLILPTLAVVAVYLITTLFSVAPSVSFWGSYQRLQGTDTTFSYIAIFLVAAGTLRTHAQFNRVINTALAVSLPIALYGIIQHFQLDPLPWGGDVTVRVAANMGNSIFVAAYLIMVVPLAAARWIETLARTVNAAAGRARALYWGGAALGLIALAAAWVYDFWLGIAAALALGLLAALLAWRTRVGLRDSWLAVVYAAILAAQLVAIFFTQSRGPWLGLGGGLFAFAVLYALVRGARQVVLGSIGLAVVGVAFLVLFNLPSSPLAPLKKVPYIGRLGQILDSESATAQVRELIWQGAVKLVVPHAPLWSPTGGEDTLNAIRPLVGYGPEAMYVVYNSFYPPDLAHLEQRNASPDRSHNETFDSLVMTGLLGFGAYILLFVSIFYYGLKWLGVINSPSERNAFVALWLAGGFVSAVLFGLMRGWYFVGVALPAGMVLGLFAFLVVDVVRRYRAGESNLDPHRALWLSALLAALIGHFIEIHFGIAIVSTRVYFWTYAALLVVLGMNRLTAPAAVPAAASAPAPVRGETAELPAPGSARRRKRRRQAVTAHTTAKPGAEQIPLAPILVWTAVTTIIVIILSFEFVNNQAGVTSTVDAVQRSLLYKGGVFSPAIFALFVLTWAIAGFIGFAEEMGDLTFRGRGLGLAVLLFAVLSFTAFVWFVLFLERSLTTPGDSTDTFVGILSLFYIAFFLLVAVLAFSLAADTLVHHTTLLLRSPANTLAVPVLLVAVLGMIYFTNFTNVSADILYKAGDNYDKTGAWDRSIDAYQRALVLQPNQDFYALFLGRAYLEAARSSTDPAQRAQLLSKSGQELFLAQRLNPLNTDHTANLARLQRIWATLVDDPAEKASHLAKSDQYYQQATKLSPNTAYLYNEWCQTYLLEGNGPRALAVLEQSLKIDSQFAQTYVYLGDYYRSQNDAPHAADSYLKALALDAAALSDPDGNPSAAPMATLAQPNIAPRAIAAYAAVADKYRAVDAPVPLQVHYALAELYKRNGQPDRARQELEAAVRAAPKDYMAGLALVNFYSESGQIDAAVGAMQHVMDLLSPNRNTDYQRFQDFYAQLQNLQRALQTVQKSPNDANAHRSVASLWKGRGQPQFALPEYQAVARLVPNDYDASKNVVLLALDLNRPEDAQSALVTAAGLAPNNEKPIWQNLQAALNAQKAQQFGEAVKQAQAALALAPEPDRPLLQAYLSHLQQQPSGGN